MRPLRDNIMNFGDSINEPCILLGAFNNVPSLDEKHGGVLVTNYDIQDFVDRVGQLYSLDMLSVGCSSRG